MFGSTTARAQRRPARALPEAGARRCAPPARRRAAPRAGRSHPEANGSNSHIGRCASRARAPAHRRAGAAPAPGSPSMREPSTPRPMSASNRRVDRIGLDREAIPGRHRLQRRAGVSRAFVATGTPSPAGCAPPLTGGLAATALRPRTRRTRHPAPARPATSTAPAACPEARAKFPADAQLDRAEDRYRNAISEPNTTPAYTRV